MNRRLRYQIYGILFQTLCLAANASALGFLAYLLFDIGSSGWKGLNWNFLTAYPSSNPGSAGILSAIVGTFYSMLITAAFAIPMGIGAAVYLEEYARNTRAVRFIKLNIQNLAGVPSIVYGILGLTIFVRAMFLGRSILAGSLTMAILILPIITIATQESLRAVPDSFRLADYGIGMTRWQVVRYQVLPVSMPGILTGIILSLSRAIGESAPLILIGAMTFVPFLPANPLDSFTVLPIQIYNWTGRPQKAFHDLSASGIIVLLVMLLILNAASYILRNYFQKQLKVLNR